MPRLVPDILTDDDFPVRFGRYTLLGLLGEGGMARVFKAELQGPEGFRKKAALKIVRAALAAENKGLRVALTHEARLGGLLHHPNIVDTYDFGVEDDLPWIAMEYVRGIGLGMVLHRMGPLPPPIALELGIQICAGLDHAHNLEETDGVRELIHRDLKPSNVILSRDGLAKVLDFGIAKAGAVSANNTREGMTKGTPSYMSPEQVGAEPLDRRSDLFALGSLLYELFAGRRLFLGETLVATLMSIVQVEENEDTRQALQEIDSRCPGLAEVLQRCLRRNPEDRYSEAAEIEHDLKQLARSLESPPSLKAWIRGMMEEDEDSTTEGALISVPGNFPSTPAQTDSRSWVQGDGGASPPTRAQQSALSPESAEAAAVEPSAASRPGRPPPPLLWVALVVLLLGGGLAAAAAGLLGGPSPNQQERGATDGPEASTLEPAALPSIVEPGEELQEPGEELEVTIVEVEAQAATEPQAAQRIEPSPPPPPAEPPPALPEKIERPSRPASSSSGVMVASPPADLKARGGGAASQGTPKPGRTPRVGPAARLRLVGPTAGVLGSNEEGIWVQFEARLQGSCTDPRVTLHFKPPATKWRSRKMHIKEQGQYGINVQIQRSSKGRTLWWMQAACPDGAQTSAGSVASPKSVMVK